MDYVVSLCDSSIKLAMRLIKEHGDLASVAIVIVESGSNIILELNKPYSVEELRSCVKENNSKAVLISGTCRLKDDDAVAVLFDASDIRESIYALYRKTERNEIQFFDEVHSADVVDLVHPFTDYVQGIWNKKQEA